MTIESEQQYLEVVNNDYFEAVDYKIKPGARWKGPMVSHDVIRDFHKFALAVFRKHKGEAIAILIEKDGVIDLQIVPQQTRGLSVDWDNEPPPAGWRQIGTIHSHNDASAFFSGTDTDTYKDMHGLHICLGKITKFYPDVAVCIYTNGKVYDQKWHEIVHFGHKTEDMSEWMEKVKLKTFTSSARAASRQPLLGRSNAIWDKYRSQSSMATSQKTKTQTGKKESQEFPKQRIGHKQSKAFKRLLNT